MSLITDLQDYNLNSVYVPTISAATVPFGGNDYAISAISNFSFANFYEQASKENAAGVRNVFLPGAMVPTEMTNAEYIALINASDDLTQKINDIYKAVDTQIIGSSITTEGGVDSAWSSLTSSYSTNRIPQPTNEALNSSIAAISNFAGLKEEVAIFVPGTLLNGTYNIIQKAKHAGTIDGFVASCSSLITAGTYTIKINATAVTGLNGVANTTSSTETNATANNTFAIDDVITITLAGTLTMLNFQGQLSTTRT